MATNAIEVGMGVAEITPAEGEGICGYIAREQTSLGSREPLLVTAFAARSGSDAVAVLSADVLAADQAFADALRETLGASCGLGASAIAFASTHTHSAPALRGFRHMGRASEAYRGSVLAASRAALEKALGDLREAALSVGRADVHGVSHNRRSSDEPLDKECIALRADRQDGSVRWLVQWQCHAVCYGADNRLTGPDFVGPLRRSLLADEADSGALYLNGCFGDVNPVGRAEEGARVTGEAVAETVRSMKRTPLGGDEVGGSLRRIALPLRREMTVADAEAHLAECSRAAEDAPEGDDGRGARAMLDWAEELLRRVRAKDLPPDPVVDVQTIRIGDAVLCFLPCEPMGQLGLDLKARSPWPVTMPVGCANGVAGYLGPRESFGRPGYELDVASRYYDLLPFEPGCGEMVTETVLAMLGR